MDAELKQRLDRIEQLTLLAAKDVFSVGDLALYLGRSPKTIRNNVEEYPHYRDAKNRIWFNKAEINAHLCRIKHEPITIS